MIKRFMFLIVMLFIFISSVRAQSNVFTKTFDTKVNTYGKTNNAALYKFDNLGIGEDVLTINFTHENELTDSKCEKDYCLTIRKYDRKGNMKKELYIQEVNSMLSANVINDYLFVLYETYEERIAMDSQGKENLCTAKDMIIKKYDSNLDEIASKKIEEYDCSEYQNPIFNNIFGLFGSAHNVGMPEGFYIDGNVIIPLGYDNNYEEHYYDYYDFYQINGENDNIVIYSLYEDYIIDKDLKTVSSRPNTWKSKYGGDTDYSYNLSDPNKTLISGTIVEGEKYIAFLKENTTEIYQTEDYYAFAFPIKTQDYYVVLGLADKEQSDILVFDKNNKLVQTISGYYWNLRAVKDGFAVTNLGTSVYNYFANAEGTRNIKTEVFYPYIVETKTDGNGTIEYNRFIENNKEYVEFTIKPKEGYVLGQVKVTDSTGKTIIFTNYKFTMPTSNVLIEATFIKKNPNTSDIAIGTIIIIAIVSLLLLIAKKRRLQLLK